MKPKKTSRKPSSGSVVPLGKSYTHMEKTISKAFIVYGLAVILLGLSFVIFFTESPSLTGYAAADLNSSDSSRIFRIPANVFVNIPYPQFFILLTSTWVLATLFIYVNFKNIKR